MLTDQPKALRNPLYRRAAGFAAVALGLVLTACGAPSDQDEATPTVDPRVESLLSLDDGGVFHSRELRFRRHNPEGPTAEEIATTGVFPEDHIREFWALIDADGELVDQVAVVRGLDGALWQVSTVEHGELVVESPLADEVKRFNWSTDGSPIDAPGLLDAARGEAEDHIASGDWTESAEPGDANAGLLRFREELSLSQFASGSGGDEISLPYTGDLDATLFYREHVYTDSYLPVSISTWAESDDGSRQLVEQTEWEAFEGLPAADWNPQEFATNTEAGLFE